MRASTVVVLASLLLESLPDPAVAEEAPLPAAFLEFLAETIEEEGELLDPLLLAPDVPGLLDEAGAPAPQDERLPAQTVEAMPSGEPRVSAPDRPDRGGRDLD